MRCNEIQEHGMRCEARKLQVECCMNYRALRLALNSSNVESTAIRGILAIRSSTVVLGAEV